MATYTVSKRMRELGIRVALGAHRAQLMKASLSRPQVVLLAGSMECSIGFFLVHCRYLERRATVDTKPLPGAA